MKDENSHAKMKARYEELFQEDNTRTAARVLFLKELLESGMSKREAAHALSDVDPLLGRNSAETIAYTNFSGEYRTIKRRSADTPNIPTVQAPDDLEDDEGLL